MRSEFEETGLTFSEEGSPYCPIERKRRGVGAILAAMGVFAIGAGVFGYTLLNSANTPEAPILVEMDTPLASESPTETAAPEDVPTPKTAADRLAEAQLAIAQSKAVRTGALENTLAQQDKTTGISLSVKPASAEPTQTAQNDRPLQLNAAHDASVDDQPPPFLFPGDRERGDIVKAPAALAFSGDVARDFRQDSVRITKGENFVDALKRAGVNAADRNEAAYAFGKHYNLRRLRPGQEFKFTLGWPNQTLFQLAADGTDPQARLLTLEFRPDPEHRIAVRRDHDGALAADKITVPLTTRTTAISGVINGSLYLSAKTAGAPDGIIAELADAFAYDVDFQREIRGGDEFEAVFEVKYDDRNVRVATGDLVYARLNWRGRREEKGYYSFASKEDGDRKDFYDATGQSARRLLMKTPIDGARLSSGFGTRRHPILGYRKAHKGVDFAAPRGTPIKAAGDGVIERADRYGSFGNYVRIRHANGYKTAYAHLKGFRSGIRKGKRVRQGDIIGYVGTTGRSTGPHLHYEVHLNGKAVNPQRLKIATGKQLRGSDLERFKEERDRIDAMRLPKAETAPLYAKEEEVGAESAL